MKSFLVAAVFLVSVLAFGATLRPKTRPGVSRPPPVELTGGSQARRDGGTHDEEELTAPDRSPEVLGRRSR